MSVFDLEQVAKKLKRVTAPDPLHKSSCSTVQGAATDGEMYAYTIGDSLQYGNPCSITLRFQNCHSHILAEGKFIRCAERNELKAREKELEIDIVMAMSRQQPVSRREVLIALLLET